MRTLHVGLRVSDLARSLAFYRTLGYRVVGEVPETAHGRLTMLALPGDEFVGIELVHDPDGAPVTAGGLNHLVIQVDDLREHVARLQGDGIEVDYVTSPDGSAEFLTSWVTDPDGYRFELVQWPQGHAAGMSDADFTQR